MAGLPGHDDQLFLYTDGVTEANNVMGELFRETRLEEVLTGRLGLGLSRFKRNRTELVSSSELCRRVRGAVDAFAEKCLDRIGCPHAAKTDLLVALDEIANNVAQYSGSGQMSVVVEMARNPSVVRISVSDDGRPWNPLEHLDPDITLSADERQVGGLGILMVKKLMDDVSYVHERGRNVLRFRKLLVKSR